MDGHHGRWHILGGVHDDDVGSPAAGSGYAGRRVATKVSAASSVSDSSRDGLNPISSMMTSSSHLAL